MPKSRAWGSITLVDTTDLQPEIVVGTQTAATGSWTGVTNLEGLVDGQQITYWLPYAGSGNASLTLTLKDGSKTSAVPIYWRGASRVTTHFPAGSMINMTYKVNANVNGTNYTGWWTDASYDSGNTYDRIRFNNAVKAKTAITGSRLIVADDDGCFHLTGGIQFDLSKPILWAGSNIAVNTTGSNNYISIPSVTLRNNLANVTLTSGKTCYLVGILSGHTFTVKSSNFFTDVIPTSDDGQYYISLGYMVDTYRIYLYPEHPIFKFVNGTFKSLNQVAVEANTEVNSLEIGGRNLVLDSEAERSRASSDGSAYPTRYTFSTYGRPFGHDSNQVLTVSAHYEVTGNEATDAYIYLQHNGTQVRTIDGDSPYLYVHDTPEGVYKVTYKPTAAQASGSSNYIAFRLRYGTDGSVIKVKNVKLELGSIATDWTPAPEDVDDAINTAKSLAETKNTVFFQDSQPSTSGRKVGDTWFDTNDGNKIYRWTGSAWEAETLGNSAIANLSASKITAGSVLGNLIMGGTIQAGGSSTGKDGELLVKDASNNEVASLSKTGLTAKAGKIGGWNITSDSLESDLKQLEETGGTSSGKSSLTDSGLKIVGPHQYSLVPNAYRNGWALNSYPTWGETEINPGRINTPTIVAHSIVAESALYCPRHGAILNASHWYTLTPRTLINNSTSMYFTVYCKGDFSLFWLILDGTTPAWPAGDLTGVESPLTKYNASGLFWNDHVQPADIAPPAIIWMGNGGVGGGGGGNNSGVYNNYGQNLSIIITQQGTIRIHTVRKATTANVSIGSNIFWAHIDNN